MATDIDLLNCVKDYIRDETNEIKTLVDEFNELKKNAEIERATTSEKTIQNEYRKRRKEYENKIETHRNNIVTIEINIGTESVTAIVDLVIGSDCVIFKRIAQNQIYNKGYMYTFYTLTEPVIWINGAEELLRRISSIASIEMPSELHSNDMASNVRYELPPV